MIEPQALLTRAGVLIDSDDVDALLAMAACRIGVEVALRERVACVLQSPLPTPSIGLSAVVLRDRGIITHVERNALSRLAKLTGRAMHTARTTTSEAERVFDFSAAIVERLRDR